jgi:hypothetical protein
MAFLPDGMILAMGWDGGMVEFWNVDICRRIF